MTDRSTEVLIDGRDSVNAGPHCCVLRQAQQVGQVHEGWDEVVANHVHDDGSVVRFLVHALIASVGDELRDARGHPEGVVSIAFT